MISEFIQLCDIGMKKIKNLFKKNLKKILVNIRIANQLKIHDFLNFSFDATLVIYNKRINIPPIITRIKI